MALFKKPTVSEPEKPISRKPADNAIKTPLQPEPVIKKEPEKTAAEKPGDLTTETKTAEIKKTEDPAGKEKKPARRQIGRIEKEQLQLEKLIEQQKALNEKIERTRKSIKTIAIEEEKKSRELKQRVLLKYGLPLLNKEGFESMGKLYEIIDSEIKSQHQRKLLGLNKTAESEKK